MIGITKAELKNNLSRQPGHEKNAAQTPCECTKSFTKIDTSSLLISHLLLRIPTNPSIFSIKTVLILTLQFPILIAQTRSRFMKSNIFFNHISLNIQDVKSLIDQGLKNWNGHLERVKTMEPQLYPKSLAG